jgi:hypothetical protein
MIRNTRGGNGVHKKTMNMNKVTKGGHAQKKATNMIKNMRGLEVHKRKQWTLQITQGGVCTKEGNKHD